MVYSLLFEKRICLFGLYSNN